MSAPWQESLDGPRSLGTAPDVAVVALEDPGEILVDGFADGEAVAAAFAQRLGLPGAPGAGEARGQEGVLLLRPDARRLRIVLPRAQALEIAAHAADGVVALDVTGASSALRAVGPAAQEILARLLAGPIAGLRRGGMAAARLAGLEVTVVREDESVPAYLILVPRSAAYFCARLLVEAARGPKRLNLFAPR